MKGTKIVFYIMYLSFVILLIWAFKLQVLETELHRTYLDSLRIVVRRIEAPRGRIMTEDGMVLAWDEETFFAKVVGNVEADAIEKILGKSRKLELIMGEEVPVTEAEALQLSKYGVMITVKYTRRYQPLAAHVVGYIDSSRKGISGVEREYDDLLSGSEGSELMSITKSGRVEGRFLKAPPIPGSDIVLTINSQLQTEVEKLLKESGLNGCVIVQSSQNGDILAMASFPSYDQNIFVEGMDQRRWNELVNDPNSPLLNRAISAVYPPGSVIKPLYVISYLETSTEWDIAVNCKGYFDYIGSSGKVLGTYRDWYVPGHGETDLRKAIRVSCNVFFYNLALKLGIETMSKYASLLMIDQLTDIDLPGEVKGSYPTPAWKMKKYGEQWYPGDTILAGIGQGFVVLTPIEVLNFYNIVANRGICWQPHVLRQVKSPLGKIAETFERRENLVVSISDRTLDFLWEAMKEVTKFDGGIQEQGTAYRAFKDFPMSVAGKTGTAETGRPSEKAHSWFVGITPAESPEIIVLVVLENGGSGGETAAPLARKIFDKWLEMREDHGL